MHALESIAVTMAPRLASHSQFVEVKEIYQRLNHARNGAKHLLADDGLEVDWPDSLVMLLRECRWRESWVYALSSTTSSTNG